MLFGPDARCPARANALRGPARANALRGPMPNAHALCCTEISTYSCALRGRDFLRQLIKWYKKQRDFSPRSKLVEY